MSWNILYAPPGPGQVLITPNAGLAALTGHAPTVASSGGGVLATAAAALGAGKFGTATLPAVWDLTQIGTDSIFEFVDRAEYDLTNKIIRFVGISHDQFVPTYCEYNVAADTVYQETFTSLGSAEHGYNGFACDNAGRSYFHSGNGSSKFQKRANGGGWTEFDCPQAGWPNTIWHPGLNKAVVGKIWGIYTFDPSNNSWAQIQTNGLGDAMSDEAGVSAFNHRDGCAYVGNNNGANPGFWKVNAAGTCTKLTDPPITLFEKSAGNNTYMIREAANSSNFMAAIRQDASIALYNDTSDTWNTSPTLDSTYSAFVTWLQGATNNQWIAVTLPDLGVIVFIREHPLATMDSTVYLWKW